ncbi:MAG: sigma-70 family RNA polymerase sigma factor [Candidatus Aerophobetes bacterium]|nr:sigma-70 family RNA polymerase sigma factor [Candidatus Aerophobetes bacterium]
MEENTKVKPSMKPIEKIEEEKEMDTLRNYLKDIGKTPLLTEDEEKELAEKIKRGRDKLACFAIEAANIIKNNQELLFLYKRKRKSYQDLNNLKSLEQMREIVEFLEQEKEEISKISPDNDAKRITRILKRIERIKPEYEASRKKMIEANLRLVVSFAKKYTGKRVSFSDLIQEGNIGLSRAVDKFDYRRKRRFSTYASWWIRQSLSRAIANQSRTIRLPAHVAQLLKKLSKISRQLQQKLGREPTPEEIAERANISPRKIRQALGIIRNTVSIERKVGENKNTPMIDFIPNATIPPPVYKLTLDMLKKEVKELLEKAVRDERELEILKLRFGLEEEEDHSLREIGKRYGVSRERIRQIQKRALNRLREPAEKKGLKNYLELLDTLRVNLQEKSA